MIDNLNDIYDKMIKEPDNEKIEGKLVAEVEGERLWENVYMECMKPKQNCDICVKVINKFEDWISFKCECDSVYHKACLLNKCRGDIRCIKCNNRRNEAYEGDNFICKYINRDKYIDIYNNSIVNRDNEYNLKLYERWFLTYNQYAPPLLDLYKYMKKYNPIDTTCLIIEYNNTRVHVFDNNDKSIILDEYADISCNEKLMNKDKYNFVNMEQFKIKLKEATYNLIGDDFVWNDTVVLMGGMVHKCLDIRVPVEKIQEYSDVDIFIINRDVNILTQEVKRVIKYFQLRLGENIYWVVRRNIINLYVAGYNRAIQLLLYKNSPEEIIHKFDFSHTQYLYNGQQILATFKAIQFANTLITVHNGKYDNYLPKRFFKTKELELCMILPQNNVLFNMPRIVSIEYWFPTFSDTFEHVQQQLKNIYHVDKKYITKYKPCKVYYSKIPVEFNNDRLSNGSHYTDGEIINYRR